MSGCGRVYDGADTMFATRRCERHALHDGHHRAGVILWGDAQLDRLHDENVRLEIALRATLETWSYHYDIVYRALEKIAEIGGAPADWNVCGPVMARIAAETLVHPRVRFVDGTEGAP